MSRVAVIIPTHHRPDLLARALRGVAGQTFQDLEVVVAVDGHDEATETFLDKYVDEHPWLRWIVNEPAVGPWQARYRALQLTDAPLLVFHDDDDYWTHPGFLAAAVNAFEPGVAVVSAIAAETGDDARLILQWSRPTRVGRFSGRRMLPSASGDEYWRSSSSFARVFSRDMLGRSGVLAQAELVDDMLMFHRCLAEGDVVAIPLVAGVRDLVGHSRYSDAPPVSLLERDYHEALYLAGRAGLVGAERNRWMMRRFFALHTYGLDGGLSPTQLKPLRTHFLRTTPLSLRQRWALWRQTWPVVAVIDRLLHVPWNAAKRLRAGAWRHRRTSAERCPLPIEWDCGPLDALLRNADGSLRMID